MDEVAELPAAALADPSLRVPAVATLEEAILGLTSVLRVTLIVVDILGLTYDEAAHALGTRPGTIMSRLHRARRRVGEVLALTEDGDTRFVEARSVLGHDVLIGMAAHLEDAGIDALRTLIPRVNGRG